MDLSVPTITQVIEFQITLWSNNSSFKETSTSQATVAEVVEAEAGGEDGETSIVNFLIP